MEPAGNSTEALITAGSVLDHSSPFGLPRGFKGRLAGWYMGRSDRQHDELIDILPLTSGATVLEVGFGPGQVLAGIHGREASLTLLGVDPSELMVASARRRNRTADLRLGAAGALPFADCSVDLVVSVNNLPMWPDVDAAMVELRRVLRPGGAAHVAWHGGARPVGHQRRLVLPEERLVAFDAAFVRRFSTVSRRKLEHSELWIAS